MSSFALLLLAVSTVVFLIAATVLKQWALDPGIGRLVLTLALYSLGNLLMMRIVRESGMATAFSVSAVIQLVAVNVIAVFYFSERLATIQTVGIGLAVVAVALITLGPSLVGK